MEITIVLAILGLVFANSLSFGQGTNGGLQTKVGYADVGKAKLYYEEKGKGDPIIMIHGGLVDKRMWDDQFDVFSEFYRVVRYDVRNHGNSKGVPDNSFFHEDLYKLMKFLKLDKAVIMGLSLGGRVAIDFAISYPEETKALVLCAPGLHDYPIDSQQVQINQEEMNKAAAERDWERYIEYFVKTWTDGPSRKPKEVSKAVREKVKKMAEGSIMGWNPLSKTSFMSPPALGRLDEIKSPVLAVVGDLDQPDIHEIVDIIEKNVPGTKKVTIKGVAHMLNMEKPDEFNSIVLEFLKGM